MIRVTCKLAVFALVVLLVLFPYPRQLVRHLRHVRNMDAMVTPDAPQLADLERELRERIEASPPAPDNPTDAAAENLRSATWTQGAIERLVLERVVYAWDWDLWGSADYFPSIEEMFEKAEQAGDVLREDCDGRALVAASLMRRMGYEANLVTDLRHVWVVTPEAAWMGPGDAASVSASEEGLEVAWDTLLRNVPVSLSYGVAVFPFVRELIILLAAWGLLLHRRTSRAAAAAGLILLVQGLLFMRLGFFAPAAVSHEASSWPAWVGLAHVLAGLAVMLRAGHNGRRETLASDAETQVAPSAHGSFLRPPDGK